MDKRDKKWWEEFWKEHKEGYGAPNKTLIGFTQKFIKGKKNLTAVDIASGDGRYAIPLAKMGYQVDAVEYAQAGVRRVLKNAQRANVKISIKQGDFTKLCKEKREYDLVLSSGLLEEIPKSTHKKVVNGFMGWTKMGGINIIKYCLWIKGRGNLTKTNFVKPLYEKAGWKILYFETPKGIQKSKAKIKFDESIEAEIMSETVVAIKPTT